jgi:phosphonate degradation associated HDIG domain protein
MNIRSAIEEVFQLYGQHGDQDYIGEPVSQMEHMLQAGELARRGGYDEEVVLAAFFHDIGHLLAFEGDYGNMGGYGVEDHERLGADFLRALGFSERIATLVESHVQAKRYLTAKDPAYYNKLSEASKHTLELQGGRMSEDEQAFFEAHPLSGLMVKLRLWDDEAKEIAPTQQTITYFRVLAEKHLTLQMNKV